MNYAKLQTDFSFWQKQTKPLFNDLFWNIPEQKTGSVLVIGGNSQNFSAPVKTSEFLSQNYPLSRVTTLLPDSLRSKLPPLANLEFAPSTASGSFAQSTVIADQISHHDGILYIGDFSKNSETGIALSATLDQSLADTPANPREVILTRDTIDLLAVDANKWLNYPQITMIANMAQLQKVFRAVYYPKMIMLSQGLVPTIETLHKFTLTYPVSLLTFHQEHIITAHQGQIITTPIVDTAYSPISLWSGSLASKALALRLYNPQKPFQALNAAIFH